MASPPLFVARYDMSFFWDSSASPKTAPITTKSGDLLVVCALTSDSSNTLDTPTGGDGLTYTLQTSITGFAGYTNCYIWTAPVTVDQTFTMSVARIAGTGRYGFSVLRFSGNTGVGAVAATHVSSGAPSLGITTTGDDSIIVMVNDDWNGLDGTSRAYLTVNQAPVEQTYKYFSGSYTSYVAYYPDAGTLGAKTVGLSAPGGQKYSIAAIEIKSPAPGVTWYALYDTTTGALLSLGTVLPIPPTGTAYTTLSDQPDLSLVQWDTTSHTFVSRAQDALYDRVYDDLWNESGMASVWAMLDDTQDAILKTRLAVLLGPYRYRFSSESVDLT